tara:strand:- start:2080 stop:2466 length:387 start_codon:yes stop_codon:yes gene_type:complete
MGWYKMSVPKPTTKPKPFHTPSIYDKRTKYYRADWVFPTQENSWWKKKKKNPVVRAVIHHALTLKVPFTVQDVYDNARYHNGNLVKSSGRTSPNKWKVEAMIRYCGFFQSKRVKLGQDMKPTTVWRRK